MHTALKILQLKAKQQVYTLLSGHNLSKLRGEGYDFSELREYQIGDDIRKINWTISAKLGKPYIKEFETNRELSVVLCALMDARLYFGSGNAKQKKLCEVATLLGYATVQNADVFRGIAYMHNTTITTPPTKHLYHINDFSNALYHAELLHSSLEKQKAIEKLFKDITKPSLVFVLDDFLDTLDLSLLAQKHEVISIIIREREEENPTSLGEVSLVHPQNTKKLETYFAKRSIKQYKAALALHEQKRIEHFTKHAIRSVTIYTDEEPISKLVDYLFKTSSL